MSVSLVERINCYYKGKGTVKGTVKGDQIQVQSYCVIFECE